MVTNEPDNVPDIPVPPLMLRVISVNDLRVDEMDCLLRDFANEIDRFSPELNKLSHGALKDWLHQWRQPDSPSRTNADGLGQSITTKRCNVRLSRIAKQQTYEAKTSFRRTQAPADQMGFRCVEQLAALRAFFRGVAAV